MAGRPAEIEVRPLSARTWNDFVELFGPDRGASGGCWCMFWRQSRAEWKARTRHSNQKKIRRLVKPASPESPVQPEALTVLEETIHL